MDEIVENQKGKIGQKIGLFDSGFGGLTILKEIKNLLPDYDYLYLGDSLRAPYGPRKQEDIFEFTKNGVKFLLEIGAEIVILACNTSSSEALRKIQQEWLLQNFPMKKVLGVIIPTAEVAVKLTKTHHIGVLATEGTITSGAFDRELQKINPKIKITSVAAPLLVPIVEAGEEGSEIADQVVDQYLSNLITKANKESGKEERPIDTIILGCTHYGILEPLIKKHIRKLTEKKINLVSEGAIVAESLKDYLTRHQEIESKLSKGGNVEFFTTDSKEKFDRLGERFFGEKIYSKKVEI